MPHRLLPLLTDAPRTGDALGALLGVNRVTVSSLARRLRDDGIPVQVTRAGYALAPGTPTPARVNTPHALRYHGTVGSTQDEIRAWADDPASPAPHGAVVVAERQTAGRGRRGRPWDTTPGTLVFSLLLRGDQTPLPLTLPRLALLPLAAGVALHGAAQTGGLKWPNDLLSADGRKLAGILAEADLRGEEARRAILGIGVNVSAAPPGAAHLHETRPELTRADLLRDLLAGLDHWLAAPPEAILQAWRAASLTLGRAVQVTTPRGVLRGTALDLDEHGGLIVSGPQGVQTVSAGDVQLIGTLEGGPAP